MRRVLETRVCLDWLGNSSHVFEILFVIIILVGQNIWNSKSSMWKIIWPNMEVSS
jgi:hypothetical protein